MDLQDVQRFREHEADDALTDANDYARNYEAEEGRDDYDPALSAAVWRFYAAALLVLACAAAVVLWS